MGVDWDVKFPQVHIYDFIYVYIIKVILVCGYVSGTYDMSLTSIMEKKNIYEMEEVELREYISQLTYKLERAQARLREIKVYPRGECEKCNRVRELDEFRLCENCDRALR